MLLLQCILDLLALRKKHGLDCRAKVVVRKAAGEGVGASVRTGAPGREQQLLGRLWVLHDAGWRLLATC